MCDPHVVAGFDREAGRDGDVGHGLGSCCADMHRLGLRPRGAREVGAARRWLVGWRWALQGRLCARAERSLRHRQV